MTAADALSDATRNQDGLVHSNPSDAETIQLGRAAMERQRRGFEDWMAIAAALDVGRTDVMRSTHTNQPMGRRYERAMAEWLIANGFQEIDKGDRSRLLECLRHRSEIDRWRAGLTGSQRFKLSHPRTVPSRWKKTTTPPDHPGSEPRPSPVAKLKESIATLEEENHRLRREVDRGGGDLWSPEDRARDIARITLLKVGRTKFKDVLREGAELLREPTAEAPPLVKRKKGWTTPDDVRRDLGARAAAQAAKAPS